MIVETKSNGCAYSVDLNKIAFLERNYENWEISIFFTGDSEPLTVGWEDGQHIWETWKSQTELIQIEQAGGATRFLRLSVVTHATTVDGVLIVYVHGNPEGIFFRGESSAVVQQKLAEYSQKFTVQGIHTQV